MKHHEAASDHCNFNIAEFVPDTTFGATLKSAR
jgi:hypothetical protein